MLRIKRVNDSIPIRGNTGNFVAGSRSFFSIILNITFMFASNGKGLPLEANSELGMNQLSAGGGEGNEYQCVFQRPDGDLT